MKTEKTQHKSSRNSTSNFHKLCTFAFQKLFIQKGNMVESAWMQKRLRQIVSIGSLLALGVALWACNSSHFAKSKQKLSIPVLVSEIRKKNVPLYIDTIGTVTPIDSVTLKTQINGYITQVLFKEGQMVNKGDLLVQIDPQPYEAALEQAEGQLIKDQALLKNARLDLKRYKQLYKEDSISQQTLDTQAALVKQYEGIVLTDQGLVHGAKVNLQYCNITTNITGVIGLRQINPGNYVQTTDTTPITTITTISPISVVFPVPEDDLGRVNRNFKKENLQVEVYDRKQETLLAVGTLFALDSQIDNTTGTIKLKASFKNEDQSLYPNQFVNVRLKLETIKDALVVPTTAVQMGRNGSYVYLMNKQTNTVSAKNIIMITTNGEDTAIKGEGLEEGFMVVTQGHDKLTEGTHVTPTDIASKDSAKSQSKVST